MTKEGLIENIERKLCAGIQLEPSEISMITRALRESKHCFQEPYYEVIYHDKYDNTERRIMEPVSSREYQDFSGCTFRDDHFELRFRRIVRKEDE